MQRAQDELRGLLKYQVIPVESGYDEIMAEEDWQALQKKVESGGKLCILQNVGTLVARKLEKKRKKSCKCVSHVKQMLHYFLAEYKKCPYHNIIL